MIYVGQSGQHGRGVFAARDIEPRAALVRFRGPVLRGFEVDPNDYHLQIGPDLYLGASGAADDYVNHSCDPNAGFGDDLVLYALRHIRADEEITWDYSCAIDEADFEGFPCACGSAVCRGVVRSFRHLDARTRQRLRPWALPYLRALYQESSREKG